MVVEEVEDLWRPTASPLLRNVRYGSRYATRQLCSDGEPSSSGKFE